MYFIFAFQKLKISIPWGPYFPVSSGLQNAYVRTKDGTFKPVNTPLDFPVRKGLLSKMIISYTF